MDAPTIAVLRKVEAAMAAIAALPQVAAEAYANGKFGARPIVEQHFTPGNQQRNGWAPLSRDYAVAKSRGLVRAKRNRGEVRELQTLKTGQRVKVDRNAEFQSSTGELMGIGTMSNLPQLVRTGLLRQQITSRTLHRIAVNKDTALITFSGLPDYAKYLHTGTDRMPKRSPVEPSESDLVQVRAAMERFLSSTLGGTQGLPVSGNTVPGAARVVI